MEIHKKCFSVQIENLGDSNHGSLEFWFLVYTRGAKFFAYLSKNINIYYTLMHYYK